MLTPLGRCARVPQTTSVSEEVLRHLRSTADVTTRMVSVPAALRSLPATISLDVAREALETLARELEAAYARWDSLESARQS